MCLSWLLLGTAMARPDAKSHSAAKRLEKLLEADGWIPVGDLEGRFALGAVLIEKLGGGYEMYAGPGECFDTGMARQVPLGSQTFSNQLQAGVQTNMGLWGGRADVNSQGRITFEEPVHSLISTIRLRANEECISIIREDAERGTSFSMGFVVYETLGARISGDSCNSLGVGASTAVGRASTAIENCRSMSSRAGGTVIGYKRRPLWQVRVLQDFIRPAVGGSAGVPVEGDRRASGSNNSSGSVPPPTTRGVPTRGRASPARSSSRGSARSGPAPAPSTAGRVLQQAGYQMQRIAANTFQMGSSRDEFRVFSNAETYDEYQHRVSISKSYMVGKTEVTQRLYGLVMNQNPSDPQHRNPTYPVLNVSWADAVRFCNQLSRAEGFQAAYRFDGEFVEWDPNNNGYRLLTEAEWENAARARDATTFAGSNHPEDVAWIAGTGQEHPRTVGGKQPNGHGLFDMSGNAFEWVWDAYDSYPRRGTTTDPVGASGYMGRISAGPSGPCGETAWDHRVGRGGSWKWGRTGDHSYGLGLVRVSGRAYNLFCWTDNDMGFRIGRTLAD